MVMQVVTYIDFNMPLIWLWCKTLNPSLRKFTNPTIRIWCSPCRFNQGDRWLHAHHSQSEVIIITIYLLIALSETAVCPHYTFSEKSEEEKAHSRNCVLHLNGCKLPLFPLAAAISHVMVSDGRDCDFAVRAVKAEGWILMCWDTDELNGTRELKAAIQK